MWASISSAAFAGSPARIAAMIARDPMLRRSHRCSRRSPAAAKPGTPRWLQRSSRLRCSGWPGQSVCGSGDRSGQTFPIVPTLHLLQQSISQHLRVARWRQHRSLTSTISGFHNRRTSSRSAKAAHQRLRKSSASGYQTKLPAVPDLHQAHGTQGTERLLSAERLTPNSLASLIRWAAAPLSASGRPQSALSSSATSSHTFSCGSCYRHRLTYSNKVFSCPIRGSVVDVDVYILFLHRSKESCQALGDVKNSQSRQFERSARRSVTALPPSAQGKT